MSLAIVTQPAAEPISLEEAKDHLRVTGTDDDARIEPKIVAIRQWTEEFLRRRLVTQTLDWRFDFFPADEFDFPVGPIQSVTSISYVDTAGATQVLSASLYQADLYAEPGRLAPAFAQVWPSTREQFNAVTVRCVAGYGDPPLVPRPIIAAMLMLLDASYDCEGEAEVKTTPAAMRCLWPFRLWVPA